MIRDSEGKWLNTKLFKPASNYYREYGYYCPHPTGSPDWFKFWTEERRRCLEGYEVQGEKITGNYYFYLNYCPIMKTEGSKKKKIGTKVKDFPDFWDGDYDYFWIRDIARKGILGALNLEEPEGLSEKELLDLRLAALGTLRLIVKPLETNLDGGYDLIIGKARRKGFSFKNSSVAACNYFHRRNSYTMFMAYDKKYLFPKGIFTMAKNYISFINKNTAWSMPNDEIDRLNHIKASFKETIRGVTSSQGYQSEIEAISFKDNADAGRGKDCYDIIGEEVGAWGVPGGLKDTLSAMEPSVADGGVKTGMITLFGTSGDTDKGTVDFADMHDSPEQHTFMAFYDIWGENPDKIEGFFHPAQLNKVGFYDENGNSQMHEAKFSEEEHRKNLVKLGAGSLKIQARMQEHPLNSAEAFSIISYNSFPVVELKAQLDKVKYLDLQNKKGTPVLLTREDGKVIAKPVLDGSVEPITSMKSIPIDPRGCVVMYEPPIFNAPKGLYKIGYDPVRQDSGTSLAGITVYKSMHKGSLHHNVLVAEYVGRMSSPEDMDRIAEDLADYYNTTIMYENEVTGVKNYFRRIKRLNLLAVQPDAVISKNVQKSKVARVYGCHMNEQLKDAGERYVKDWLLTILDHDENGNKITVIDKLYSRRLLEELIRYHRKGNFDLVSSLFMCMFQVQEEKLGKEYHDNKRNKNVEKLLNQIKVGK